MRGVFRMLRNRFATQTPAPKDQARPHKNLQVVIPEVVVLPLPKTPKDEISVPASINGRDLSTGRL